MGWAGEVHLDAALEHCHTQVAIKGPLPAPPPPFPANPYLCCCCLPLHTADHGAPVPMLSGVSGGGNPRQWKAAATTLCVQVTLSPTQAPARCTLRRQGASVQDPSCHLHSPTVHRPLLQQRSELQKCHVDLVGQSSAHLLHLLLTRDHVLHSIGDTHRHTRKREAPSNNVVHTLLNTSPPPNRQHTHTRARIDH